LAGWWFAASAASSKAELRGAATDLVPSRGWLDDVKLGSRSAEALLIVPRKVDEQAFEDAVARRAGRCASSPQWRSA